MVKILKIDEAGEIIGFEEEELSTLSVFKSILTLKYNQQPGDIDGRKRNRAKAEMKYVFLRYDPRSPYREYNEVDRENESRIEVGFPADWAPSVELKLFIQAYEKIVNSDRFMRLCKAAESAIDKLETHLKNIDFTEKNNSGGLVNNPKDVINIISSLPQVAAGLKALQEQAKYNLLSPSKSKGDQEMGWLMEERPEQL